MVNDFEVIHMGGRTYNPILGRFMQADPFVQAPANLQNYNRYSYVLNNPMSYTDPSGYFFNPLKKIRRNIIRAAAKVFGSEVVGMVGNAASVFCGPFAPACAAAWTYEFSRAMGVSSSGALKAAFISGASAYAFQQIGRHFSVAGADNVDAVVFGGAQYGNYLDFGGNLLTAGQAAAQITAHAMVGGIAASVQGGKFGHGFFSAGVTKGAGGAWLPGGSNLSGGQVAYGTVVSAVIGGTASVIAGGKFANGARTAVFQYLYNQLTKWSYEEQAKRRNLKKGINYIMVLNDEQRNLGRQAHVPRDVFSVLSHGSVDGEIESLSWRLSVDEAAKLVKEMYSDFASPNQQVMLFVCNSGTNGFAQHLANILNVVVIAPSIGLVELYDDGRYGVSYRLVNRNAYWKEFHPQSAGGK